MLKSASLTDILSAADIEKDAEITIEANPETVTEEELFRLHAAGVNRISFGVQSLNNDALRMLGRIHTAETALNAIKLARSAGFENISADLITGLPKFGGEKRMYEDITALTETGIKHISVYMLKVEPNTPLARDHELCSLIDDDRTADEYLAAVHYLADRGFGQYEISNFAKEGYECKHNLKYWHCEDYLGIGPAAHSCIDGKRFCVPSDIADFISSDRQKAVYTDDNACTEKERFMLAMRLNEGYTGTVSLCEAARPYEKAGLLNIQGSRISLTVKGMLVSNGIIARLMDYV